MIARLETRPSDCYCIQVILLVSEEDGLSDGDRTPTGIITSGRSIITWVLGIGIGIGIGLSNGSIILGYTGTDAVMVRLFIFVFIFSFLWVVV